MRKIYSLAVLVCSFCFAQTNTKEFYVVAKENIAIEPSAKSVNPDGHLSLTFSKPAFQTFFNNKSVYRYEKAFPTAFTPYLQRTYIVIMDDSVTETSLKNNLDPSDNQIEYIKELEPIKYLYEPNDYYNNDFFNSSPLMQLDLVRAPLAWEITKGDNPNVVIGIADTSLNPNHEDLNSNIIEYIGYPSLSDDAHGTMVASAASTVSDNGKGIASVGYHTKMRLNSSAGLNTLLELSKKPNVRVVNGSWISSCANSPNEVDRKVIQEIWDSGVLPVFAAGNAYYLQCTGDPLEYIYPAAYGIGISVTAVGHSFDYDKPAPDPIYTVDKKDIHEYYWPNNNTYRTTQHNDKVDLSAPGINFVLAAGNNKYRLYGGTSFSSPMVAGAAALVFSVNPNLTPAQVKDILKRTADDIYWIPENQKYQGLLGTGRLNVFRAVKETKCMDEPNPKVDFMIKDSREDVGEQPNNRTEYMWTSSDIFVRNHNDGKLIPVHQNPSYDGVNPNYIYVRVTNMGCQTSSGTDTVSVNWAKANTSLDYPAYWNGSVVQNGVVFGGTAGSGTIPVLKPGQEALLEIPWNVPNPQNYVQINSDPWHFCLLAEIHSNDDPLTSPYTANPNIMVRTNNNLAWKNITVIDVSDNTGIVSGTIAVTNPHNIPKTFYLEMVKEDIETGKPIYEEAEVGLTMDSKLQAAWERGGSQSANVTKAANNSKNIATANNVILNNIDLNANEMGTLTVSFNFLTQETTDKEKYRYHIIQKDAATGEIMGGETFEIRKNNRTHFAADAGNDLVAEKSTPVTIKAKSIGEPATYNWYDTAGNLIFTGPEFEVSPANTTTYRLEVVALDGYKDYSDVKVEVTPYKLISMSPNPSSSVVNINYDIENASSAYIAVVSIANGNTNNYILNTNTSQKTINLSNYPTGQYSVVLIVDGHIIDSKNLIKN